MSKISFEAKLIKIGTWTLLRLPKEASKKLPSRGMVMVEGTINNSHFQYPLEPDGKGGHFLKINENMRQKSQADLGDTVKLEIEPIKDWPEPEIPADLKKALSKNSQAQTTWMDITPQARWDWIRWIASTKNPQTRQIRIQKTFSKFKDGIRRPCCFNRTECTVADISKRGMLLDSIPS